MTDSNGTESAYANAAMFASAGTAGSGTFTITGNILVSADAVFNAPPSSIGAPYASGGAGAFAELDIIAADDVDINGGIEVLANADVDSNATQGYATASADAFLSAGGDISIGNTIAVMASADNLAGNTTGNTSAYANVIATLTATASGSIDMNGVSVSADALCSGNSGTCNPYANATGNITAVNNISISGPINVQAISVASNTGDTAMATAGLGVISLSGDVNVGGANVLASAFINHGAAQALASGFAYIIANGSNTL